MDNVTNLGYIGNVTIKLKIGGKMYEMSTHNEGLNYLKYIFALLMTGNDLGDAYSPQYLDLRKEYTDGTDTIISSYLNYFSDISGKRYYLDGSDWIAELTAVISSEQLLQTILPDDTSNYYIYLMSGYDNSNTEERQHDLARLKVSAKSLAQITPGVTATLVWSLRLVNVSEDES